VPGRGERGRGKPEKFDVLGLTHYCTTRKDGTAFPTRAQDAEKTNQSEAPRDQGDDTAVQAHADRRAATVARDHDERLLRVLRGADQHISAVGLPLSSA
jgi:hypothetical protein